MAQRAVGPIQPQSMTRRPTDFFRNRRQFHRCPATLAPDRAVLPEEEPSATIQPGTTHEALIIPPSTSTSPPPSLTNFSQELLTPWSCMGMKIFVDICSGADKPLTTAVAAMGLPALAIDLLVDPRMDLLDDSFYEQLLRLCGSGVVGYTGAAPSCTEYSLLKLRPGGPRAIRTPRAICTTFRMDLM